MLLKICVIFSKIQSCILTFIIYPYSTRLAAGLWTSVFYSSLICRCDTWPAGLHICHDAQPLKVNILRLFSENIVHTLSVVSFLSLYGSLSFRTVEKPDIFNFLFQFSWSYITMPSFIWIENVCIYLSI